jgi:SGNH domain (fused to AT3 domains)
MTRPLRNLTPLRWCVVAIALVAALALPSLSGGAPANSEGLTAYFDAAEGNTPLDIFGVRFGQTASTDLTLIIRTHKPWETAAINPRFGRTLCLLLRSDEQPLPAGRLCAYPSESAKSGLALRYTVLDPQTGVQRGIRDLSPAVSRPSKTTIRTSFPPSLLRLKPGLYHWSARSQYRDDVQCPPPAGCEDLLPNAGEANVQITLSISPEARQRCFGAASRDRNKPCRNPRLARAVVPTPDNAVLTPNIPCTPLKQIGLVIPCEFGVPAPNALNTVALIGDSHAAHWRAALEIVAQTAKWRGISVTRSGCPYTRAVARLDPASRRRSCVRWNQEVPRWLAANPKISTVFVVAHFDSGIVVKNPANEFKAKMTGYARAWRALPKSVKRVVVIRDTPKSTPDTLNCVRAAMAKRKNAGQTCALGRSQALDRDAAASAAVRHPTRRVKLIDMTSFFCSSKNCFPVVGGALVYKDISHITDVFASSLGPYLLRKVRALNGY